MIDYSRSTFARLYRDEDFNFRQLPLLTKALAAYLRIIVQPEHGWLHLPASSMRRAIQAISAGDISTADRRLLVRRIEGLLVHGYLTRCRLLADLGASFRTADGREIPLSPWLETPDGEWAVIANWVPSVHGLGISDAVAWHEARRYHALAATQPATS